jgi:formylmethanofuran dehydrogenase subunit B
MPPDMKVEQNETIPAVPQQKVKETREVARHAIRLKVMVAAGMTVSHGRSEDISMAGACLRTTEMLPVGARIQVRLLTPFQNKFDYLDVAAVVRYSTMASGEPACRVGVQFVNSDADFKRKLVTVLQN